MLELLMTPCRCLLFLLNGVNFHDKLKSLLSVVDQLTVGDHTVGPFLLALQINASFILAWRQQPFLSTTRKHQFVTPGNFYFPMQKKAMRQ